MKTLFAALADHAAQRPHGIALASESVIISYGELLSEIAIKRNALNNKHIDVLGLSLPNSVDWILWDLAALQAGIVCVPLPPFFTPEQIEYITAISGMDAYVCDGQLVSVSSQRGVHIPLGTAKITFTSGTTGTPKGVCLPATGIERLTQSLLSVLDASYGERHLSVMPLAILLENVAGVYTALLAGSTVFIPSPASIGMEDPFRPDYTQLLDFIVRQRITSVILTPELLRGVVNAAAKSTESCRSLRYIAVGGATVPPALLQTARALGLPVYEGYGLSECGSVVALNTPKDDHPSTVGRLLPHMQVTVRDGEVMIQNPAFLGYLGEPERDPSEPFATGDNGTLDDKGALIVSGRRKNTIITSQGRNIAPEWVESTLLCQPGVAQVFVYGDGLAFPQALIVPLSKDAPIADAVGQANKTLPAYAQIAHFDTVGPFTPQNNMLTPTGRLRRQMIALTYHSLMKEAPHGILRQVS